MKFLLSLAMLLNFSQASFARTGTAIKQNKTRSVSVSTSLPRAGARRFVNAAGTAENFCTYAYGDPIVGTGYGCTAGAYCTCNSQPGCGCTGWSAIE